MFNDRVNSEKKFTSDAGISRILQKKNLADDIFTRKNKTTLTLDSALDEHVRWAYNNIYQVAYPVSTEYKITLKDLIPRYIHGIQHTTRVAIYVQVFANLYRKHGDDDAAKLTDEDIKLLQIAALFHDAAREDDGQDKWDHESAILLYYYLTRVLKVDTQKAKLIAEATANKDIKITAGYFEMNENEKGEVSWGFSSLSVKKASQKNIYQKIIHDADCLDIIRARLGYDARYLDFHKDIVIQNNNSLALEEMAHLIMEARSLINIQGDSYDRTNELAKRKYNCEKTYKNMLACIKKDKYKIIHALHLKLFSIEELSTLSLVDLTPYQEEAGLTDKNMQAAVREGLVFSRGIGTPSSIVNSNKIGKSESLAEMEIRKIMRELGIATPGTKENRTLKKGNPIRSVAMIGYGSAIYSDAGFLIVNPDIRCISKVSAVDADTHRGKKKATAQMILNDKPSQEKIKKDLSDVQNKLKIGGKVSKKYKSNHIEILYDIIKYDAIYYSNDPNLNNTWVFENGDTKPLKPYHRYSPLLQAIYLQNQYAIQYEKVKNDYVNTFGEKEGLSQFNARFGKNSKLPIYEYSGIHNTIKHIPDSELTDEKVIAMWVGMCSDYMAYELTGKRSADLYRMSIDDIKVCSMYKLKSFVLVKHHAPADANYPHALRQKINEAIEKNRLLIIDEIEKILINRFKNQESYNEYISVYDDMIFNLLPHSQTLLTSFNDIITSTLESDHQKFEGISIENFTDKTKTIHEQMFILSQLPGMDNKYIKYFKETADKLASVYLDGLFNELNTLKMGIEKNTTISSSIMFGYLGHFPVGHFYSKVLIFIKFINYFGVNESFENKLNKLMSAMLIQASEDFRKNNRVETYISFLHAMYDAKLLNPENPEYAKIIDAMYEKSTENIVKGMYDRHPDDMDENDPLRYHLQFFKFKSKGKNDTIEKEKTIQMWIEQKNTEGKFYAENQIDNFMKVFSISLDDTNLDLFKTIINTISLKRFKNDKYMSCSFSSGSFDINNWLFCVDTLQQYVKNSKFTDEQLVIIREKWETAVCVRYANFIHSDAFSVDVEGFTALINNLIKYSESPLRLPLDQLIAAFNDDINKKVNVVKQETDLFKKPSINIILMQIDCIAYYIEYCGEQYDKIGGKEGRAKAVEAMLDLRKKYKMFSHPAYFNSKTSELNLRGMQFASHEIDGILKANQYFIVRHSDNIKSIDFSNISINETQVRFLVYLLSYCPNITTLNLSNCKISVKECAMLVPKLNKLTSLNLSNIIVSQEDARMLAKNLPNTLKVLDIGCLGGNLFDSEIAKEFKKTHLKQLSACKPQTGGDKLSKDQVFNLIWYHITNGDLKGYLESLETRYVTTQQVTKEIPDPEILFSLFNKKITKIENVQVSLLINEKLTSNSHKFLNAAKEANLDVNNPLFSYLKWNHVCASLNVMLDASKSSDTPELKKMKNLLNMAMHYNATDEKLNFLNQLLAQYRSILKNGITGFWENLLEFATGCVLAKHVKQFFKEIFNIDLPQTLKGEEELNLNNLIKHNNCGSLDFYIPNNAVINRAIPAKDEFQIRVTVQSK